MRHEFDEDMKIAPDDISKMLKAQNSAADDNIDLFIRQRSLGNIERAKRLGRYYVEDLLDCVWTKPPSAIKQDVFELQLKLLFCYAVHRVVEDYSPNALLSNSAISSFYEHLEDAAPELFSEIANNAAFTIYIYLHRGKEESTQTIGKSFAKLCGAAQDEDSEVLGEGAYLRYLSGCVQRMMEIGYVM